MFTVVGAVLAPLLHEQVDPPEATSVVLDPLQKDVLPEMTAVGRALTVMFTVCVVLPHAFEAVMVQAVFAELTEGAPEMVPVVVLKFNPVGNAGEME